MNDFVLLTGASGFLGRYVVEELGDRGVAVRTAGRTACDVDLDLSDGESIARVLDTVKPRFLVNLAAMSKMAPCQAQPALALQCNGKAPQLMAQAADCRFLQASTDLVFGGDAAPYAPSDEPRPLSAYGMSKAEGERLTGGNWLVVRLPLLFGRSVDGQGGATDLLRRWIDAGEPVTLFDNEFRTPLHAADAARGLVDLLFDPDLRGIRHVAGPERVSRWQLAQRFCEATGLPVQAFQQGVCEDPRRPRDVSLAADWQPVRGLDEALRAS